MADPTLKYRKLAYHDARAVGLDPLAFIRQIRQESGFNTGETSSAGAQGIAQIMPGTAQSWGVDPNDPVAALRAAAKHMAQYVKQYGSLRNALIAYNAGPGAVGGPLPAETQHYIDVILGGSGPGQTKLFDVPAGGPHSPPTTTPASTTPAQTTSPTTTAAPPTQPQAPPVDQRIPKLLAVFGAMNQANANQPWLGPPQNARLLPNAATAGANPLQAIVDVGTPPATPPATPTSTNYTPTVQTTPHSTSMGQPTLTTPVQPTTSVVSKKALPHFILGSPIPGTKPGASTHQTDGLPGFPARDYFAKPGTKVAAPVSGVVYKFSGHDPKLGAVNGPGGPLGWSLYIRAADGTLYFLTHMGSRSVKLGSTVQAGQMIGTVANYDKYGRPSHIHMGVHKP